jgi:hypothetical protein
VELLAFAFSEERLAVTAGLVCDAQLCGFEDAFSERVKFVRMPVGGI